MWFDQLLLVLRAVEADHHQEPPLRNERALEHHHRRPSPPPQRNTDHHQYHHVVGRRKRSVQNRCLSQHKNFGRRSQKRWLIFVSNLETNHFYSSRTMINRKALLLLLVVVVVDHLIVTFLDVVFLAVIMDLTPVVGPCGFSLERIEVETNRTFP